MGDQILIVLKLPMDIGKINVVLATIADTWPKSKVDLDGDEGWIITVGPDES